jgi:hypothetical protein
MRTSERYPELEGFTERLLDGLDEVLVAEQARPGPGTAARAPRRARRGGVRRYAVPAVGLATVVAIGLAGVALNRAGTEPVAPGATGEQAGAPTASRPERSARETAAPIRTLGGLALVAERQPDQPRPAGPIKEVRTESIFGGLYDGEVDGEGFVVDVQRRQTEVYRRDGSVLIQSSAPTRLTFPTDRDRRLYERWRARVTADENARGKGSFNPIWPEAATFSEPADPDRAREFERSHNSGKLQHYQGGDGKMVGILPLSKLPTDPGALRRAIMRAIEPFAADSSAESDLIGKVGTRRELLVGTVYELLTKDTVTPKQRAAAFRMLETVDGVTVVPNAADLSGRKGIGVRWDDTRHGPSSPTLWVFDRDASGLLGTESSITLVTGKRKHSTVVLSHEVIR